MIRILSKFLLQINRSTSFYFNIPICLYKQGFIVLSLILQAAAFQNVDIIPNMEGSKMRKLSKSIRNWRNTIGSVTK
jgi:hypothetical protein